MKNFTYYRPTSVAQAVSLLENQWGNTELLAGGTDLHDLQKEYVAQPTRVVSLNAIDGFAGIQAAQNNQSLVIGAGTKIADIASHNVVRQQLPALADAAGQVGGPQIRNMGTLGGNLCQRNRCWYFRDEHVNCWLKGGNTCYALQGENRYHAVFSPQNAPCVYVHPSTLAPVLIVLGASVQVSGPNNQQRTIQMDQFYRNPAQNQREHVLASNEVVTSVTIPLQNRASASYEIKHKKSWDWPAVQAAVAFQRNNNNVTNVRIVLGHVAATPRIATAAAQALEGQAVSMQRAEAAGEAAAQGARALSQNGYKTRLIQVAVKRAILIAAGQQRYWES